MRLTPGFNLPAHWVIQTVGPVWRGSGSGNGEDALLARCCRKSLWLASAIGARSISIPAIGVSAYGFPVARAAATAAREATGYARAHPEIERVLLVCHGDRALAVFTSALAACG